MLLNAFIEEFQRELPLTLALADDHVGMHVCVEDRPMTVIAVAYELNESIVQQAAHVGAELIVSFHPLIYAPLRRIGSATRVERCVVTLIDHRIALYVVHTAFDAHPEGTSALVARRLALEELQPLTPNPIMPDSGMGVIGRLPEEVSLDELAERVRLACATACVRVSHPPSLPETPRIRRVAIVGGSGMSMYESAVRAGADAFITADVRYHGFHAANDRIPVLDPGHAESERFVIDGIADLVERTVSRIGSEIRVERLRASTNPVRYYVAH